MRTQLSVLNGALPPDPGEKVLLYGWSLRISQCPYASGRIDNLSLCSQGGWVGKGLLAQDGIAEASHLDLWRTRELRCSPHLGIAGEIGINRRCSWEVPGLVKPHHCGESPRSGHNVIPVSAPGTSGGSIPHS